MFAEKYQYEDAVACFEKAFLYESGDEKALCAYAYALYELKGYVKAKEVCEQLLARRHRNVCGSNGTIHYNMYAVERNTIKWSRIITTLIEERSTSWEAQL
ncbi:Tetratricopeptide repeat protein OS=Lysinibacillus sphaericus OX=1421 GN=LS41612_07105 PE=4 SV=1 [Lysinibacillus sphaericus]